MPKRIAIRSSDTPPMVFGLASHEPVWQVSHLLNEAFSWKLQATEAVAVPQKEEIEAHSLLGDWQSNKSYLHYCDTESLAPVEIYVREIPQSELSKALKAFRFFLILQSVENHALATDDFLPKLTDLSPLTSVVDLTHHTDIKRLLPV